ncbi:hypothetical protein PtB15_1B839 [Puccinia triticina]|nr:hypothetical protein PtB15_1B839 [Puccinia triticina]
MSWLAVVLESFEANELFGASGKGHQLTELLSANPNANGREGDPRQAAAAAAEAAQAAKSRGTKGGKIAKALSHQPADVGRVNQAIAAGSQPANQKPLVWD